MSKSLRVRFGNILTNNGYKMSGVNHYEKRLDKFYIYFDKDIADHLLYRIMSKNTFGEIKCIANEFIPNLSKMNKNDFLEIVLQKEENFKNLINS